MIPLRCLSMKRLILIRHGQTEDNFLNEGLPGRHIVSGQRETPLTDVGKKQAKQAGRAIAMLPMLSLSRVVSSDLERAVQTANLVLKELGISLPIHTTPLLRERSAGAFEGRRVVDLQAEHPDYFNDPMLKNWRAHFVVKAPGGENFTEVTERVRPFLNEILKMAKGDILCVSHRRVMCCILHFLLDLTHDQTTALHIPNAQPIVITIGPTSRIAGEWTLEKLLRGAS